jgi:hypothetical protein
LLLISGTWGFGFLVVEGSQIFLAFLAMRFTSSEINTAILSIGSAYHQLIFLKELKAVIQWQGSN